MSETTLTPLGHTIQNPFSVMQYEGLALSAPEVELFSPLDWYNEFRNPHGFCEGGMVPTQAKSICERMVALLNSYLFHNAYNIMAFKTACTDHNCYIQFATPQREEPLLISQAKEGMQFRHNQKIDAYPAYTPMTVIENDIAKKDMLGMSVEEILIPKFEINTNQNLSVSDTLKKFRESEEGKKMLEQIKKENAQ